MRRGSSSLFIIIGLFLVLAAGVAFAVMVYAPIPGLSPATAQQLPPTAEPQVPRVQAEIDIPAGTVFTTTEGLLKTEMVPASQFMSDVNLSGIEQARDMVATTGIKAGDPIRKDMLRKAGLAQKIPAGKNGETSVKAFPLQVNSLSGVADLIQPGDFVDILASLNVDVVTIRPGGVTTENNQNKYLINEQTSNEGVSKVLLQDVEVLDVIKPAPPADNQQNGQGQDSQQQAPAASPAAAPQNPGEASKTAPPPLTIGNTLNAGNWILVVAVSNQESEVLRFALDRGIGITTMLRRAGDHTTERTVGATMRILVDNYGMPMPSFPQVVQQPSAAEIPGVPMLPQVKTPAFVPTVAPAK